MPKSNESVSQKQQKSILTDTVCRFCDIQNLDFQHEATIDIHYSQECVMLTSCENCDLVVEIMKLDIHMLKEYVNRQFVL